MKSWLSENERNGEKASLNAASVMRPPKQTSLSVAPPLQDGNLRHPWLAGKREPVEPPDMLQPNKNT